MITFRENEKTFLINRRHKLALLREVFPSAVFFLGLAVLTIVLLFLPSLSWPGWMGNTVPELLNVNLHSFFIFRNLAFVFNLLDFSFRGHSALLP